MNRFIYSGLVAATALCLVFWGLYYSSFDLWGDELVSMKDYALANFKTIVTIYPGPNNHVLFNLLNNAVSDLWGIQDIYQAMDRVPLFRGIQWLIAVGTCLYVFLMGKRFFSTSAGVISIVFLVTCLPFLNFSMQLRGYCLSMFFAAGLTYHTWLAEETPSWKQLVLVSLMAFGMLYAVPSNAYYAFAMSFLVAWRTAWPTNAAETGKSLFRRRGTLVTAALASGAILALLAYSPILGDLFNNRFVQASPGDRMFILTRRLPQVVLSLISFRYLIVPIALGGFYFALRKSDDRPPGSEKSILLIGLLGVPFFISFFRNDEAFQRTFIFLAPISSLTLGAGTVWFLQSTVVRNLRRDLFAVCVAIYAFGTLGFAHVTVQEHLKENLRSGIKAQNLMENYYQLRGFRPSRLAVGLAEIHRGRAGPILLVDDLDPVSLSYYLLAEDLTSTSILSIRSAGEGESGTHIGSFQKSLGRGKDLTFFESSIHLSNDLEEGNRLTPALVVAESMEPSDMYFLITAFPEKNRALFQGLFPSFLLETVIESEGFSCFRISMD
ncbi:MAG: glycosyltransferase family 39 protein [Longimicrobiales bacterium]|nr:glycosyltransferase family 39 protein [Longimicrobiales bacterium]